MRHVLTTLFSFFMLIAIGQTQNKNDDKYDLVKDSLIKAGHIDQLIPYFLNEVKREPNNEEAYRWLGYLYLNESNADLGEKYYREAIRINPGCGKCYMHIARASVLKKDTAKAWELLDKAITIDPNDPDMYSLRSDLKALTGDMLGAVLDVNKAIRLDPKDGLYYVQKGLLNAVSGYNDPAIADFSKAIELDPSNYNAYLQRGKTYYRKQQYEESLADMTSAARADSTQQIVFTNRADLYKQMQKYPESIADYTKALTLDPNDFYSYYYRGEDKFMAWDIEGCCEDMNKGYSVLKATDAENPFKEYFIATLAADCDTTKPGYYIQKASAYNLVGKFDKTIEICSKGIQKKLNDAYLYFTRSGAYFSIFNYSNAINDCVSALTYKETLYRDISSNNMDKPENEIKNLVNTTIAIIHNTQALSNLNLGHVDEALTNVNLAIEIAPAKNTFGMENFYESRGVILITAGKYQEAKNNFDTCIMLNASFAEGYNQRAMLELIMANDIKLVSNPKSLMPDGKPAKVNWDLPLKMTIKKDDPGTRAALADCDKAIQLDPNLADAYFLRGAINKEIGEGDYCKDLLKAGELGYYVDPVLLKKCKK